MPGTSMCRLLFRQLLAATAASVVHPLSPSIPSALDADISPRIVLIRGDAIAARFMVVVLHIMQVSFPFFVNYVG